MKHIITLFAIFCSLSAYTQNTGTSSDYDQVILNGKPAFINIKTGQITTERPTGLTSNSQVVQAVSTNTPQIDTNTTTHTVVAGETLYSISKKYGVTIAQLKALNTGIDINAISINQSLIINTSTLAPSVKSNKDVVTTYEVQEGDTLYSISRKFDLSITDLKRLNNLSSNDISVGQQLLVK